MLIDDNIHAWEKSIWQFIFIWLDDSQDSFLQESSGSTGTPKKIHIKKEYAEASARKTISYFDLKEGQTIHLCMNPAYIGAKMIIVRAFIGGLHLTYSEASANALCQLKHQVDLCAAVPLQVYTLLEKQKEGNEFIKNILIGGGIISTKLKNKLQNQKTKYYQSFGMTETISHIAIRQLSNNIYHYHCLDGIHISQDQQDDCLIVHAPEIGVEHLKSNDIIELINDKDFEWLGRKDNVINSGGIKIYAEKIEALIESVMQYPFYISSTKDEKLGNRMLLYIESKELFDKIALLAQLKPLLPPYHLPTEILIEPSFQYTATGKIIRKKAPNC